VDVSLDSLGRASYEFADDAAWDHIAWSDALDSLARVATLFASALWRSDRPSHATRFNSS